MRSVTSLLLVPVLAVILAVAPVVRAAQAGHLGPGDDSAIRQTITDQLDAFENGDVLRAWSFASPGIRGMFQTPDHFGIMVRDGYPMVWHPDEHVFGELRDGPRGPVQRVEIRDGEGRLHLLDYAMTQTDAGWRVDAVRVLRAPAPAV